MRENKLRANARRIARKIAFYKANILFSSGSSFALIERIKGVIFTFLGTKSGEQLLQACPPFQRRSKTSYMLHYQRWCTKRQIRKSLQHCRHSCEKSLRILKLIITKEQR
ncbi:hypothetical protein HPB48_012829 [Haemaphysalis longicornis]|uniref:Uncharacterized protein n=1 Tax=Haemaphysalis longicornis TaxID=44386 RepID=A0A9J6GCF2_HAELO|nr:hypothetical protein HPB48_012829 [Haemaphysalis longicornis]